MTPINDDTAVLSTRPEPEEREDDRTDSLAEELARAAPKRWWNRGTVVLGALVLLVGGFVGGLQAQKHWGTAATTAGGNRGAGGFAGGQNRAGYGNFGGGTGSGRTGQGGTGQGGLGNVGGGAAPGAASTAAPAAAGTTGTVQLVDGSTIYVQTAAGDVVTVKTDGKTTVSTASTGKLADVKAGQSVTVQGATGSDGTVTATSVTAEEK